MARQPEPATDQLADLTFPLQGLDVSNEFGVQPPNTTPQGQNVRAYEALTRRGRGGSRPGLSRYVSAQVGGSALIQHLTYIVDPTEQSLATAFDPLDFPLQNAGNGFPFSGIDTPQLPTLTPPSAQPGDVGWGVGGIPNPANPQWYIRTGGSGIQLNNNIGTSPQQTPGVGFQCLQAGYTGVEAGYGPQAPLNNNVRLNSLIIVACLFYDPAAAPSPGQLTDSLGNNYQSLTGLFLLPVPNQQPVTGIAQGLGFSSGAIYYCVNKKAGQLNLNIPVSGGISGGVISQTTCAIVEYSGNSVTSPLAGSSGLATASGAGPGYTLTPAPSHGTNVNLMTYTSDASLTLTTNPYTPSSSGQLVTAILFPALYQPGSYSVNATGFTQRIPPTVIPWYDANGALGLPATATLTGQTTVSGISQYITGSPNLPGVGGSAIVIGWRGG